MQKFSIQIELNHLQHLKGVAAECPDEAAILRLTQEEIVDAIIKAGRDVCTCILKKSGLSERRYRAAREWLSLHNMEIPKDTGKPPSVTTSDRVSP